MPINETTKLLGVPQEVLPLDMFAVVTTVNSKQKDCKTDTRIKTYAPVWNQVCRFLFS
jgi:hypothetical protein